MAEERVDQSLYYRYLVLDPRRATFRDLIKLLYSSDLEGKRNFIACPQDERRLGNFRRRWLIFVSLFIQKLLILLRNPLDDFSRVLEFWLNLVSINGGGFTSFLANLFKGKLEWPRRSSETFRSVIGHLDSRVDLDRRMKMGSDEYNAMISIMASKVSYEGKPFIRQVIETHWKMDFVEYCSCWNEFLGEETTQAFVFESKQAEPSTVFVAFRGTQPFNMDDWRTDVDISWFEVKDMGRIHGGFMKALGLQISGWPKDIDQRDLQKRTGGYAYYRIRKILRDKFQENPGTKFVLTGHSLGGALAVLFVAVLALHKEEEILTRLEGVFTFGQPRVGDQKFGKFMKALLERYGVKYRRFVYCNDMVPRLPFDDKTLLFKHFGSCLYYDSLYRGQVKEEEPNKNYFNVALLIPKMLNAVWELLRGFIMPFYKGPEYGEGWLLRLLRMVGLVIPGLSAHSPQDYVNLTRLRYEPFFRHDHYVRH